MTAAVLILLMWAAAALWIGLAARILSVEPLALLCAAFLIVAVGTALL